MGFVRRVNTSGSNALALGARTCVGLRQKRNATRSPKPWASREANGVMPGGIPPRLRGSGRSQRSKSCGRGGCTMTSASMRSLADVFPSSVLPPLAPSSRRRTSRLTTPRNAKKRRTPWEGELVHLPATCEASLPLRGTPGETPAAPVAADAVTTTIPAERERTHRLPSEPLGETGDRDAPLLVASQRDSQLHLLGPTRTDDRWQASQPTGDDAAHVLRDWQPQHAPWPQGHTRKRWTPARDPRKNEGVTITFSPTDSQPGPARWRWTPSRRPPPRPLTIRPEARSRAREPRRLPGKGQGFSHHLSPAGRQ